jgi:D-alanine-D-alanine ligase
MARTRILLIHNRPVLASTHPEAASEAEILETAETVLEQLRGAGFRVEKLAIDRDPLPFLRLVRRRRPDVVFNLFEGTGEDGGSEGMMAALLENAGLAFTGSQAFALTLARDKYRCKRLFQGAGLATPNFTVLSSPTLPPIALRRPLIIKPALQDASIGLDHKSVVTNRAELATKARSVLRSYGPPVLVEEFIDGKEFEVSIVEQAGRRLLAVGEVRFTDELPWRIVTYSAKWRPGSRDDLATPVSHPAVVSAPVRRRLYALALAAFDLLGCRDYARADIRLGRDGKPMLLEMNPNPSYHPSAGFVKSLTSMGLTHLQCTVGLLEAALARRVGNP